ncbi:hypothetical protein FACS1894126_0980 [Alphaproteobacteria bacterium]|nr:hypothetical protein FACS1894126_0980 [Alphaproteobacteria bacterium]
MSPEFTIVISFLGFSWIFAKKIYPLLVGKLDEHIRSVKEKIRNAEVLKNEAYVALKNARMKKDETQAVLEEYKRKTEEKMKLLQEENEILLQGIRERYEISMKAQLEAEVAKQKNQLIEKLSDLLIERLQKKFNDGNCQLKTNVTQKDLEKLL